MAIGAITSLLTLFTGGLRYAVERSTCSTRLISTRSSLDLGITFASPDMTARAATLASTDLGFDVYLGAPDFEDTDHVASLE